MKWYQGWWSAFIEVDGKRDPFLAILTAFLIAAVLAALGLAGYKLGELGGINMVPLFTLIKANAILVYESIRVFPLYLTIPFLIGSLLAGRIAAKILWKVLGIGGKIAWVLGKFGFRRIFRKGDPKIREPRFSAVLNIPGNFSGLRCNQARDILADTLRPTGWFPSTTVHCASENRIKVTITSDRNSFLSRKQEKALRSISRVIKSELLEAQKARRYHQAFS